MDDVTYLPRAYQLITLNRLPISRYISTGGHANVIYEITYRHHKQLPFKANLICFSMKFKQRYYKLKIKIKIGEKRGKKLYFIYKYKIQ